jgi:hypothetical protein
MSKHDYIYQIESKIEAHRQTIEALQREIDKLEGAADVIRQLRGNDGALALDVTPEKKAGPLYTIRKKVEPPAAVRQARKPYKIDKEAAARTREMILQALQTGPCTSGELIAHLGDVPSEQKQRVYASLTKMKEKGLIERNEQNVYSLPAAA